MATTITVDNFPPSAAPQGASLDVTTSWQTLIEPANFSVPVSGQATVATEIQPGAAEIISPLMIANTTATGRTVSVRITRSNGDVAFILSEVEVAAKDLLLVPLNGQVLLNGSGTTNGTGDKLEILAEANDAIDATISWTQGRAEATDGS